MRRRSFLTTAGVGVAATSLAAPAIAQSMPELKWRCTTSWPKSLDTLFGGAEYAAKRIAEMTDNKFQIRVFAGGEIVPALQVVDAVQNGTVEMGHTASYYYFGKDPTFAFDCAISFGLNERQTNAWYEFGGGKQLLRDFFKEYSIYPIPCGNTGCQMGGWFRKEIKTIDDMKGVKMRIGGFAGGDIYPALEKGTIDAAEWVGPYDDEKLGFNKIAPYYYYPGWWEGGPQLSMYIGTKAWESLTPSYKAIVEAACAEAHKWMVAKYDADNPAALRRLVAGGTQLRPFTRATMEAFYKASLVVMSENSEKYPWFKKIYANWVPFRDEQNLWFRVAESTFDGFMSFLSSQKKA